MPITKRTYPATVHRSGSTVTSRPALRPRDAMLAAAWALADGRVEPVEHRSLNTFLKNNKMLSAPGRGATITRCSADVARATGRKASAPPSRQQPDSKADWQDLADRLRPLAGMEAARLVAALVAVADGVVNPRAPEPPRPTHEAVRLDHAPIEVSR